MRPPAPRPNRAAILLVALLLLGGALVPWQAGAAPAPEPLRWDACPASAPVRAYSVTALPLPISYNRWGDLDLRGQQYVLDEDRDALLEEIGAKLARAGLEPLAADVAAMRDAFLSYDLHAAAAAAASLSARADDPASLGKPRERVDVVELQAPLVLRAHVGDCVLVRLTNVLPAPVSIHVHDVVAPAGAGAAVGANAPDLTATASERLYPMYIPAFPGMEGAHFLHSHADTRDQTRHGLFGALVAQPQGAVWLDESDVTKLAPTGLNAIIHQPGAPDFREFVTIYHDQIELVDWTLKALPTVSPYGEYGPGTKGINLRSEPFYDRFKYHDELRYDDFTNPTGPLPRGHDKSQSYGSYTYGDPGVVMPRSYLGDPAKFRLINAGPGQHHIHHLHGGGIRWKATPAAEASQFADGLVKRGNVDLSASQRMDVINAGPGESFTLEPEGGSGGVQQSVGDFLFHCHIAEHYLAGMWSLWRTYNTLQDDLAELPDRWGVRRAAVSSADLVGMRLPNGSTLTLDVLPAWVEAQLPARGVPAEEDASVWDWSVTTDERDLPVYLGEPETVHVWPNYPLDAPGRLLPGERPVLGFDPLTGKLAYPHLRPHLGERPPFAPDHGPAPFLTPDMGENAPDGLCAPESRKLSYDMVAIEARVPYNRFDADSRGQVLVRAEDRAATQAPGAAPTSAVLRANAGDCIDVTFVNTLKEKDLGSVMQGVHQKSNIHIHLVQFDVQASDGVVAGFNYEATVRTVADQDAWAPILDPSAPTVSRLEADAPAGATQVQVRDLRVFRDATGAPKVGSTVGLGLGLPSIETARLVAVTGGASGPGTITLDRPLAEAHAADEPLGYEFVRYRWYADVELGTVYFHDHVDGLNTWRHGLFGSLLVEPRNSTWLSPTRVDDTPPADPSRSPEAVAPIVDIVPGNGAPAFRELALHFQDRACVSTVPGDDCLSLALPLMPDRMREPAGFNLRSEPLHRRNASAPFSSLAPYGADEKATPVDERTLLQGDPATPMLHAYPGDEVMVRFLYAGASASRGVATFGMMGHRFAVEEALEGGRVTNALSVAISSQHNLRLECGAGGCLRQPGDYLYGMTQPEFLDRGAWGLLRVHDPSVSAPVRPLPSNPAPEPGVLPSDAPVRKYDVAAVRGLVMTNPRLGLHETMDRFVFAEDALGAQLGRAMPPDPLVLRALPGEVVEVRLTNLLPSGRVGLSAGMLPSVSGGPGFAPGRDADATLAPGQSTVYRWYADRELGTVDLVSYADPVRDAARGLYAALIVEPAGSSWTGRGASTTLHLADGTQAREQVLLWAHRDSQFESSTMPYAPDLDSPAYVNFATEPLTKRAGVQTPSNRETGLPVSPLGGTGVSTCQVDPDACAGQPFDVRNPLNSAATVAVMPWTPIVRVAPGQPLVLRIVGSAGDQLNTVHLSGHVWASNPEMDDCRRDLASCRSHLVSTVTIGPREKHDAWIPAAAPGGAGDYMYRAHRDAFFEAGAWGILRAR